MLGLPMQTDKVMKKSALKPLNAASNPGAEYDAGDRRLQDCFPTTTLLGTERVPSLEKNL